MPLLSKSCIYGLRACMLIASRCEQAAFVATRDIASELQLSPWFLTKILRSLTTAGILTSLRGPGGGVALARPPVQVSLLDLVGVLHGQARARDRRGRGRSETRRWPSRSAPRHRDLSGVRS